MLFSHMLTRRDLLKIGGQTCAAAGLAPLARAFMATNMGSETQAVRCINIVNFIREIEPRFPMDMILPVQEQMKLIREHDLPATWLLQFDALVSGPFVPYLKANMTASHEVGFWFEMNEKLVKAAEIEWRGRPGYEWDFNPCIAFTIGYTPEERIKLADTAMHQFKSIWGKYPSSVASWNLDAITVAHLVEHYGVDAFAVCRDQIATDGFTIWGAPIAGYYPSKTDCWSPAIERHHQISSPVFRMLGQDPVYYYDREWTIPGGQRISEPDTMEPVWTSGRSSVFVDRFLEMIESAPTGRFAYAQLGQENTFPWPQQAEGYPMQMKVLAEHVRDGKAHVETMGESGRRFKKAFSTTPVQAQVQLQDSFGNTDPASKSIWYQSRFYRANLHIKGDLPYLRDITVYSDRTSQPFLTEATRQHEVNQSLPAILDGYHWRQESADSAMPGAGGFFRVADRVLRLLGEPKVREEGSVLIAELPVQSGSLIVRFLEDAIAIQFSGSESLTVSFQWDPKKSTMTGVQGERVAYRFRDFDYGVAVTPPPSAADSGWSVSSSTGIRLALKQ
jgi:hypothetical protein